MTKRSRVRKKALKLTVIADGLKPFDMETRAFNVGGAVRKAIEAKSVFWHEALYYIHREDETTSEGYVYNNPEEKGSL